MGKPLPKNFWQAADTPVRASAPTAAKPLIQRMSTIRDICHFELLEVVLLAAGSRTGSSSRYSDWSLIQDCGPTR